MGVYDRQRATALRLIEKYGEQVTWTQASSTTPTSKPWLGTTDAETVTHSPHVVFITSDSQVSHLIQALAGSTVANGDTTAYVASLDFDPSLADTINRQNGSVYRIKSIDPLQPNAERPILYTLELNE